MWMSNDFCYENSVYNPQDVEYYLQFRSMCRFYLSWVLPLIIVIGIVGSVFCLIFLLFSKLFPKNLLLWLVSICVADLMILLLDGLWMLLKMWIGFDIRDINHFLCVSHKFLSNYFFYWSAYMQMMVSIQRAYLIMRPLQARSSLVLPRLVIVWITLSVILILPHVIYLLRWRVRKGDCDPEEKSDFHVTTLCDLIIWGIVPFIAMVISTCIISINVCVFQSRSFGPRISTPKVVYSFVKNNPSTFITKSPGGIQSDSSSNNSQTLKIIKKVNVGHEGSSENLNHYVAPGRRHGGIDTAKHVTQLLIGMNLWYMLTTFPLLIFLIYLNFIDPEINSWKRKFLYYLLRSFSFYNACSNWIFYCAAGRLFRTTAKQILIKMICSRCVSTTFSSNSQASAAALGIPNKYTINPRKTLIP